MQIIVIHMYYCYHVARKPAARLPNTLLSFFYKEGYQMLETNPDSHQVGYYTQSPKTYN